MLDSNPSLLNDQGILFSMAPPSCRTDTYDAVAGYHRECHTVWYDTDGIDAFVCRWLCQVGYLNRIQDKPISDQILVCPESDVDDKMWVCPESGVDRYPTRQSHRHEHHHNSNFQGKLARFSLPNLAPHLSTWVLPPFHLGDLRPHHGCPCHVLWLLFVRII